MISLRSLLFLPLICVVSLAPCRGETPKERNTSNLINNLNNIEETAKRYFASAGGYQEGDLISQSQIQEFQDYLRKTRGHSPATHPRLLTRVLRDNSRLVRLFNRPNGADLLREAVAKGNGYGAFKNLTHSKTDFAKLTDAFDRGAVEDLIQMADQKSQQLTATTEVSDPKPKRHLKPSMIYTVADYLTAVNAVLEKSAAEATEKAS
jgi:hypothetical protein